MPKNSDNEDPAVKFSSNLIGLFSAKVRSHNKKNSDNKISCNQLKEVFLNAAANYDYAGCTRAKWALARVNTFLRVLGGGSADSIQRKEHTSLGGLVFESTVIDKEEKEYDISENWIPSQEDLTLASQEINEYELDYNFDSIDELYLNQQQPIGLHFNFEL